MTEKDDHPEIAEDPETEIRPTDARQGLPTGFMPFILGASTALAIVALFVVLIGFLT